jgi:hypothetical protein
MSTPPEPFLMRVCTSLCPYPSIHLCQSWLKCQVADDVTKCFPPSGPCPPWLGTDVDSCPTPFLRVLSVPDPRSQQSLFPCLSSNLPRVVYLSFSRPHMTSTFHRATLAPSRWFTISSMICWDIWHVSSSGEALSESLIDFGGGDVRSDTEDQDVLLEFMKWTFAHPKRK